jgi:hypothetical protein
MAKKKPLVLTNGQIEQLQSGDQIDLRNSVSRANDNAGAITIGQPVYATSGTNVDLAQADAQGTVRIKGLVADVSIAAAASGDIIVDGILEATTGQWDAVTGDTGGLTPGSNYFLAAGSAGGLTTTAPSGAGEFVVRVGHALSSTEFEIEIQQPIKL